MDRADAELASAQRSQRGYRPSHHAAGRQAGDGSNRQAAYGLDGQTDTDDAGVHKLGRAAEHDFDRWHTVIPPFACYPHLPVTPICLLAP